MIDDLDKIDSYVMTIMLNSYSYEEKDIIPIFHKIKNKIIVDDVKTKPNIEKIIVNDYLEIFKILELENTKKVDTISHAIEMNAIKILKYLWEEKELTFTFNPKLYKKIIYQESLDTLKYLHEVMCIDEGWNSNLSKMAIAYENIPILEYLYETGIKSTISSFINVCEKRIHNIKLIKCMFENNNFTDINDLETIRLRCLEIPDLNPSIRFYLEHDL